jgi:phenylpropionate dioxygenase-like ring-hydroxylating dioxygenase large terminal subunit
MGFGGTVTLEHPELGTAPIETDQNVSAGFFEQEREKIFRRVWLNVGRVDDVPKPGDYVVVELEVLRTSVIIARGHDQEIRAFHNICPHRGNKVTRNCRGKANAFTCGFHGWVFDLKGRLSFVRDEEGFFDFNKAEYGLKPLAIGVWEGFVFVNADPQPRESLAEFLGTLGPSLNDYPFSQMKLAAEYAVILDANWKVAQDAFSESYHVGVLHRNTLPQFSSDENPFGHMLAFRLHKYHSVASVVSNPDATPTAFQSFLVSLRARSFRIPGEHAVTPRGLNPTKSKGFRFDLHNIFPNFGMHLSIGSYYTHSFFPISPNRTRWVLKFYGYPPANAAEAIASEYTKVLLRDAVKEDVNTFECTQRNLESGMLPYMVLNDHEMLLRHKYKVVADFVNGETARTDSHPPR